jgi:hypothetical protein
MSFKITNTDYFYLPNNPHMLHLATISYSLREFILMLDVTQNKIYIEEVVLVSVDYSKDVWANFKFIEDDSLAEDLYKFCEDKKLIDMKRVQETILDRRLNI